MAPSLLASSVLMAPSHLASSVLMAPSLLASSVPLRGVLLSRLCVPSGSGEQEVGDTHALHIFIFSKIINEMSLFVVVFLCKLINYIENSERHLNLRL